MKVSVCACVGLLRRLFTKVGKRERAWTGDAAHIPTLPPVVVHTPVYCCGHFWHTRFLHLSLALAHERAARFLP